MNISGAGDLTLTGGLTAKTLDAGSATGKMTLTMNADGDTITMGSGKDALTIGDADSTTFESTINMGAGDDTLTLSTLGITTIADLVDSKVTLDGGDGEDTLVLTDNAANNLTALSAANYAKKGISNFEKLQISTAMDLDVVATRMGINDVNIKAGIGADKTLTVLPGAKISLGAAASDVTAGGGDTLTVTATGANAAGASSDAITLTLAGAHANATTSVNYGEVTIANVETINIVSSDSTTAYVAYTAADHNIVDLVATSATTINVTGDMGLELNDGALESFANVTTFNASDHTGPSLGVSFASGAAVTFTGGSGADTVVGSGNADTITTGAGNDVITGGDGADVITTGAGTDTVTVAAQSSAGIDQITDFDADKDSIITGVTED
jgi:Ca2+-binding RTX toxin-like protein